MGLDIELMQKMRCCGHLLYHRYPLNMSQNRVLLILKDFGPMSQKEMVDRMGIQSGSLSEVISKVEADGYITRLRSEKDRRNYDLALTPSGLQHANDFEIQRDALAVSLFKDLTLSQQNELDKILDILISSWKNGEEKC